MVEHYFSRYVQVVWRHIKYKEINIVKIYVSVASNNNNKRLTFNFQCNDILSMFCMKSTSLKILIFDFLLLLNLQSQELPIVFGNFHFIENLEFF